MLDSPSLSNYYYHALLLVMGNTAAYHLWLNRITNLSKIGSFLVY